MLEDEHNARVDALKEADDYLKAEEANEKAGDHLAQMFSDAEKARRKADVAFAFEVEKEKAEDRKRLAKEEEKEEEQEEKEKEQRAKAAGRLFSSSLMSAMTEGVRSGNVLKAFEDLLAKMAEKLIQSAVLKLMTQLFEGIFTGGAGSALGVLGDLFGAAEGGLVSNGRLVRMASGGVLSGGTPGVDSIGVLAQEGEAFLTSGTTSALRRELSVSGGSHFAAGGVVSGTSLPPPQRTAPVFVLQAPMSRAEYERHYRDVILPSQNRMARYGYSSAIGQH
jgi:hypothetical protein